MAVNIIFVHLLNDFSGSPRVLIATIQAYRKRPGQLKLYLGSDGDGLLSGCGIPIQHYWYKRSQYRFLTLFSYLLSQLILFCKLLADSSIGKNAIIYVNTLLPFGAALYGKLTGREVIYHVHEISISPGPLKWLLTNIARRTSALNIYVSDTHMKTMVIPGVPAKRIYNGLSSEFLKKAPATPYVHLHAGRFNVLMIASLRDYKGVPELLDVAKWMQDQHEIYFDLVTNDDTVTIQNFFSERSIPQNITIHPRTNDVTEFYKKASLVLNLSRVDLWVETFGLTILEAMAFGIPVIAPPVGGPTELVDDGVNGYLIDSRSIESISAKIVELARDQVLCQQLSSAARLKAKCFSPEQFAQGILATINSCEPKKIYKKI